MAKSKRKNKKLLVFSIIAVAIVIIIVIIGFSTAGSDTISVTTTKVERKTITQVVSAIGKIQPEKQVKISSETSGEIEFLGVEEGDTVTAGKLLVKIKPDIIETQLEQLSAAMKASKIEIDIRASEMKRTESELKRNQELYEKEFVSQQELERVRTAYEQAAANYQAALARYQQSQANMKEIQRSMARTSIYAPISGIVTKLQIEKGEKVVGTAQMQGTEMMIISDLNVMNAVVEVDENDIINVSIGDMADIEIDAFPERVFKGTVTEIGHSAIVSQLGTQDQVTNFEVKVRVVNPDTRLRPGMSCNVEIKTETRENVIAVPLQAVTVRSDNINRSPDVNKEGRTISKQDNDNTRKNIPQSVVFIVNDDNKTVKTTNVDVGISDRGWIEIKEGLQEGEKIVSGSFNAVSKELEDGSAIKIDSSRAKFTGKKN